MALDVACWCDRIRHWILDWVIRMRTWLIKILGGYTKEAYGKLETENVKLSEENRILGHAKRTLRLLMNMRMVRDADNMRTLLTLPSKRMIVIDDHELVEPTEVTEI